MRRLEGVAALITGASSGIGRGLARVFPAMKGAQVFLTARGEDRLWETAGGTRSGTPGADRLRRL